METPCEGRILLVGDGDFSFTLSLIKQSGLKGTQVTTSNLETSESIHQHQLARNNMEELTASGVCVLLETDARELHTHPVIGKEQYQRVIFNFPLVDRHHIKKNRALLADFFSSCSQILNDDGQVMVTLCKGQGGTPADQPMRSWQDSWQVVAMASNAGFILTNILPFEASKYPEYHSVGFRFQDKSFNTEGALTHIFEQVSTISESDSYSVRGVVKHNGNCYSCSQYIAEKFKRNLMQESNNPLCHLREKLENVLFEGHGIRTLPDGQPDIVVPGHKARTSLRMDSQFGDREIDDEVDIESTTEKMNDDENTADVLGCMKAMKNQANLDLMKKKEKLSPLMHGVDSATDEDRQISSAAQSEGCNTENCPNIQTQLSTFVPENSESVYVLIKSHSRDAANSRQGSQENDGIDVEEQPLTSHGSSCQGSENENNNADGNCCRCGVVSDPTHDQSSALTIHEENMGITDSENLVYHFRTSLLENFNGLCENVWKPGSGGKSVTKVTKAEMFNHDATCAGNTGHKTLQDSYVDSDDATGFHSNYSMLDIQQEELGTSRPVGNVSFLVSGQCFLPSSILPGSLPVRHQIMIVTEVLDDSKSPIAFLGSHCAQAPSLNTDTVDLSQLPSKDHVSGQGYGNSAGLLQSYNSTSEAMVSYLRQADIFHKANLSVRTWDSRTVRLEVDGCTEVNEIKFLYLACEDGSAGSQGNDRNDRTLVGLLGKIYKGTTAFCICLLQLDDIACKLCGIKDPRLLWSQSKRFRNQFRVGKFPQKFSPFSLYPMKFAHDLSFWENECSTDLDVHEMCDIIRYVAGDLVVSVNLVDIYTDPNTGKKSRCYRLHFLSHDKAFPYLVSWKLQSRIRMEIAHRLKVTLR